MRGGVILLGGFDGLHVGHRLLLSRAKEYGVPVGVMTIAGGKGDSVFTLCERESIYRRAGVDFALELPFAEIKELSPQAFVALVEEQFVPKAFVCGEDFRFGKSAAGDPELLRTLTTAQVDVLPLLEMNGEKVSSSTVKAFLSAGKIEEANTLLGEPFFLLGTVQKGRMVGRTIGFPTANLAYPDGKHPLSYGVYASEVDVDGKTYQAITNFGSQPTFSEGQVCVETHLDRFEGDLYGRELTVRFIRKIRDIRKFACAEDLQKQLWADLREIRE